MHRPRNFPLGLSPFTFADLYDAAGLRALSQRFDGELAHEDAEAAQLLAAWRGGQTPAPAAQSEVLLRVASVLGRFVAGLFAVDAAEARGAEAVRAHAAVYAFKQQFVDKRVRRRRPPFADPLAADVRQRLAVAWAAPRLAHGAETWTSEERAEAEAAHVALEALRLWGIVDRRPAPAPDERDAARLALQEALGRPIADAALREELGHVLGGLESWHADRLGRVAWVSYRQPEAVDPAHVERVATEAADAALPEALDGPAAKRRRRLGFTLTDDRMRARDALAEVDYCLLCHPRGKDSCRTGLHDKAGNVRQTPLGTSLTGCPLDQRISEAHTLLDRGEQVAALAMVMRDNPMCPGTGHRICNDCMKSCIFQKQEPVNVPQVETHLLRRVLALPYGFEIYALLTRFNPLRAERPYPLPYHGHNVLVVGLGPAGYTLAHYLLTEGFGVAGIDGLKLEPMPADLLGRDEWPPRAVHDVAELHQDLGTRTAQGFGGVAEYGITVRWDKNFLKLIYLNLLRWRRFCAFGGVRLGSTLDLDDAWKFGFDHVALAAGAGRPTVVPLKNNLMRGMRAASDFLMGLQLTGAFRADSLANLQVELPAVVIGGGLTAVDTATELAAYYPVQVRKLRTRVQALGEDHVRRVLDDEENATLTRMLAHADELACAEAAGNLDTPALVRRWGGVKVAYRRGLTDSPAYRLNHEEVQKALEEGISFVEHVTPLAAVPDAYNHVDALEVRRRDGSTHNMPARSVIVAAGTTPNTIYSREYPGSMVLDAKGRFFQAHELVADASPADADATGQMHLRPVDAPARGAFFTSYTRPRDDAAENPHLPPRTVSFFGDNHPAYAGNVVRAMASAKHGHRPIVAAFAAGRARALGRGEAHLAALEARWSATVQSLRNAWEAKVMAVNRLTPTIVEVVVHAPAAARNFKPGQFFRLQNFEADAPVLGQTPLNMEGLALTGAWVDAERGLVAMVALEMGVSSRLCGRLNPGQGVVVMGPTGAATEVPEGETVLLCGGGLGNAVLFSVARALRARGNRVLYFAAYRTTLDMYKQAEVEAASDQVVWSVDGGPLPEARRQQDRVFRGNIVQAMQAYAAGELGEPLVKLQDVDRVICIGSDRMMAAVAHARRSSLQAFLKPSHEAIASINSPMQCMMKEVCAQCLQRHIDPVTQKETYVFSCFNQDQRQDTMDWEHLAGRLRQNTLMEKISGLTLDALLAQAPLPTRLSVEPPQPVA